MWEEGLRLRQIASEGGQAQRIALAINWPRRNFDRCGAHKPVDVPPGRSPAQLGQRRIDLRGRGPRVRLLLQHLENQGFQGRRNLRVPP
jgi:hypothetical protein